MVWGLGDIFSLPSLPSLVVLFFKTGSVLYSPSCPGTHYIDQQSGLELRIHLPLPPYCWINVYGIKGGEKLRFIVHHERPEELLVAAETPELKGHFQVCGTFS